MSWKVAEIFVPGQRISGAANLGAQRLLEEMIAKLDEAAIALNLFESFHESLSRFLVDEGCSEVSERAHEIEARLSEPASESSEECELRAIAQRFARHEFWCSGRVPRAYLLAQGRIFAKAFLLAVDGISKCIRNLKKLPNRPDDLLDVHQSLLKTFPSLTGVRDSVAHSEDRMVFKQKNGDPLNCQPISAGGIVATLGGDLVVDHVEGNTYHYTVADGTLGSIDITQANLEAVASVVQRTIYAYRWEGRCYFSPKGERV